MSRVGRLVLVAVLAGGVGAAAGFVTGLVSGAGGSEAAGSGDGAGGAGGGEREVRYWVAPMDPNFRRDAPGKSPMGMDLVPVYADEGSDEDFVRIDPAVVQNLGVRTAVAERGRLWRLVRGVGRVALDESRISHVHLRTPGWLEELGVAAVGDTVQAGEPVARVYAPALVNAQKEFLSARARGVDAVVEASREKLVALGMAGAEIERLAAAGEPVEQAIVPAPRSGVVTALNVRENMYVEPATTVLEIADLSRVWVEVDVFPAQADWVAAGQSAELTLPFRPGQVHAGEVVLVEPLVDPASRTVRVRLAFANEDRRLLPDMYGRVKIYGGAKAGVLSVPADALIRGADTDRVVLALGDGRFAVQEVRAGLVSGDYVEILAGLEAGDRVVTRAQFLIDSEASLTGALRRLGTRGDSGEDAPVERVMLRGRVLAVKPDGRATIAHEPVEALGWPAMAMDFAFAEGYEGPPPVPGRAAHLVIEKAPDGRWRVAELHDLGPADGDAP